MLFKELLPQSSHEFANLEIKGITCNSKEVTDGFVFVCIKGAKTDGHRFAKSAAESGAAVIVAEEDTGLANQIIVEDTHKAYSLMCANWFGKPANSLKLVGVTGTNGKTSVTYMIKSILENEGYKVGLIGTIQNMIGDKIIAAKNTTPDAYELNSLFSLMKAEGCEYAIMEVSSHALDQKRVCELNFETAVFTNLTQDHLDYHITMENYLGAKKKLFKMCKTAIINSDDEYSEALMEGLDCNIITCSASDNSTYSAKGINYRPTAVDYQLVSDEGLNHITVNTGGKFSVYNSMFAVITAKILGIPVENSTKALAKFEGVKGRAEVVPTGKDFTVIIDYAHTPDGLKNILSTFRDCPKNRLISLFGCGGDRDKTKRAIMGSVAVRYSDYVIVTSDNPRSEEPMAIIEDILEGTRGSNKPVKVIGNRIEAIKFAISIAEKDDIIVLAGKGHETYQILKEGTIHLDEREVVKEALAELNS
ncbi:MAG: UDP-N-acetylmuramoyl-L-alanyl-D-glutamate--2,6-diaminopimelate ligase [Clostridia bacterium]|nr:UDP-N-acetylmuramoyl-L-alanyl-D-glutamate--2,6-diaminopimelate ligase [Clostridia bacterium]